MTITMDILCFHLSDEFMRLSLHGVHNYDFSQLLSAAEWIRQIINNRADEISVTLEMDESIYNGSEGRRLSLTRFTIYSLLRECQLSKNRTVSLYFDDEPSDKVWTMHEYPPINNTPQEDDLEMTLSDEEFNDFLRRLETRQEAIMKELPRFEKSCSLEAQRSFDPMYLPGSVFQPMLPDPDTCPTDKYLTELLDAVSDSMESREIDRAVDLLMEIQNRDLRQKLEECCISSATFLPKPMEMPPLSMTVATSTDIESKHEQISANTQTDVDLERIVSEKVSKEMTSQIEMLKLVSKKISKTDSIKKKETKVKKSEFDRKKRSRKCRCAKKRTETPRKEENVLDRLLSGESIPDDTLTPKTSDLQGFYPRPESIPSLSEGKHYEFHSSEILPIDKMEAEKLVRFHFGSYKIVENQSKLELPPLFRHGTALAESSLIILDESDLQCESSFDEHKFCKTFRVKNIAKKVANLCWEIVHVDNIKNEDISGVFPMDPQEIRDIKVEVTLRDLTKKGIFIMKLKNNFSFSSSPQISLIVPNIRWKVQEIPHPPTPPPAVECPSSEDESDSSDSELEVYEKSSDDEDTDFEIIN